MAKTQTKKKLAKQLYALIQWVEDSTYTPGIPLEWIKGYDIEEFRRTKVVDGDESYVVEWRNKSKEPKGGWNCYDGIVKAISGSISQLDKLIDELEGERSPKKCKVQCTKAESKPPAKKLKKSNKRSSKTATLTTGTFSRKKPNKEGDHEEEADEEQNNEKNDNEEQTTEEENKDENEEQKDDEERDKMGYTSESEPRPTSNQQTDDEMSDFEPTPLRGQYNNDSELPPGLNRSPTQSPVSHDGRSYPKTPSAAPKRNKDKNLQGSEDRENFHIRKRAKPSATRQDRRSDYQEVNETTVELGPSDTLDRILMALQNTNKTMAGVQGRITNLESRAVGSSHMNEYAQQSQSSHSITESAYARYLSLDKVEIGRPGSNVCISADQWDVASEKKTYTSMATSLLIAAFAEEDLLRSNMNGGKSKIDPTAPHHEALDSRIMQAIRYTVRTRFPETFVGRLFGAAINNKLGKMRRDYNKESH